MKRFIVFIVILLICIMSATFVACDDKGDNDEYSEYSKITLRSDMTLDEVKEALEDVEIFTAQSCSPDGTVAYEYTWARNGYSCILSEGYYGAKFFEGNMYYDLFIEGKEEDIKVVDCSGYDTTYSHNEKTDVEAYLESIYELMSENEYAIKDNVITVSVMYNGALAVQIIVKNFNATKLGIPEKYKDTYKTLKPTTSVLVYEDIDENTCRLSQINVPLKSLEIPEKYNGKTVTWVKLYSGHAEKLTLSKAVKIVFGLTEYNSVVYLGTIEEWYENVETDKSQAPCDIVCTDGTINKGDTRPTAE